MPDRADSERQRICEALVALVAESGSAEFELDVLLGRAGVDRGTFRRHFADVTDCLDRTWEEMTDAHIARVTGSVAGPRRHERLIDDFARQLREARPEELRLTGVNEQALVGAIVGLVRARVSLGETPSLRSIAPQATQFILAPYIGSEEANRIAAETST